MQSNEIWKNWGSFDPFEQRAHRFREEMRPLLFQYLGIREDSRILDAGCGTGVLARFLSGGLTSGHADGFDINAGAIAQGTEILRESGLSEKVTLRVDDGFALSFKDDSFDAVTNYTYLGVVSDPEACLREMIRVCRPGGTVSSIVATNSIPNIHWQGDYPIEGMDELQSLADRENVIFSFFASKSRGKSLHQAGQDMRTAKLFRRCDLTHIRMHPFAHLICYDDDRLPFEQRRELALGELEEDIAWIAGRYNEFREIYDAHGFTKQDMDRLLMLMKRKLSYLEAHFGEDEAYEWHAGLNFIVTGIKKANG